MLDIYMYIHTHSVSKKWAIDLPVLIPGLCKNHTQRTVDVPQKPSKTEYNLYPV